MITCELFIEMRAYRLIQFHKTQVVYINNLLNFLELKINERFLGLGRISRIRALNG